MVVPFLQSVPAESIPFHLSHLSCHEHAGEAEEMVCGIFLETVIYCLHHAFLSGSFHTSLILKPSILEMIRYNLSMLLEEPVHRIYLRCCNSKLRPTFCTTDSKSWKKARFLTVLISLITLCLNA